MLIIQNIYNSIQIEGIAIISVSLLTNINIIVTLDAIILLDSFDYLNTSLFCLFYTTANFSFPLTECDQSTFELICLRCMLCKNINFTVLIVYLETLNIFFFSKLIINNSFKLKFQLKFFFKNIIWNNRLVLLISLSRNHYTWFPEFYFFLVIVNLVKNCVTAYLTTDWELKERCIWTLLIILSHWGLIFTICVLTNWSWVSIIIFLSVLKYYILFPIMDYVDIKQDKINFYIKKLFN